MTTIDDVVARVVINSRGELTLEVDVISGNVLGRASSPSGKSKGAREVADWPKGGVKEALSIVNLEIRPKLKGMDASDQESIDDELLSIDGTDRFERIGGNTAYALSLACADLASKSKGIALYEHLATFQPPSLPLPLGNILGGGAHAKGLRPDVQEVLVVPLKPSNMMDAFITNINVYKELSKMLSERYPSFTGGKGDEGALAPPIRSEEALELASRALDKVSSELGAKAGLGIDLAASSLWDDDRGKYVYRVDGLSLSPEDQLDLVLNYVEQFNLVYVEDPLHEYDYEGFANLLSSLKDVLVCGDDLIVSNESFLDVALSKGSVNCIIVKPNQVGTLTLAKRTAEKAKGAGITTVASHRSGETTDTHLSHLAVALGCEMIKCGVMGGERVAKANELIRIEEKDKSLRLSTLKILNR